MQKILLICLFLMLPISFYGQTGKGKSTANPSKSTMGKNPETTLEKNSDTILNQNKSSSDYMMQQGKNTPDTIGQKTNKNAGKSENKIYTDSQGNKYYIDPGGNKIPVK